MKIINFCTVEVGGIVFSIKKNNKECEVILRRTITLTEGNNERKIFPLYTIIFEKENIHIMERIKNLSIGDNLIIKGREKIIQYEDKNGKIIELKQIKATNVFILSTTEERKILSIGEFRREYDEGQNIKYYPEFEDEDNELVF